MHFASEVHPPLGLVPPPAIHTSRQSTCSTQRALPCSLSGWAPGLPARLTRVLDAEPKPGYNSRVLKEHSQSPARDQLAATEVEPLSPRILVSLAKRADSAPIRLVLVLNLSPEVL